MVSHQDTEHLISVEERRLADCHRVRKTLYTSSSRCCQTKTSILISKGALLLVGMAVLIVGVSLAWTVTPHLSIDCNESSNCSAICQSSSPLPLPTPTTTQSATPPFIIAPTPTSRVSYTTGMGPSTAAPVTITPSPVFITPPPGGDMVAPNGTMCDCEGNKTFS